jgi:hypothetical protein
VREGDGGRTRSARAARDGDGKADRLVKGTERRACNYERMNIATFV